MRKLATLFGLLMLAFSAQAQAPRSNDPIPYIYYYFDIEHAIVIERADGTDSHLIAKDVMPKEHTEIYNVSWSSSGEWIAWESAENTAAGNREQLAWVAKTDGSWSKALLPRDSISLHLSWSPIDDKLLIASTDRYDNAFYAISVYQPVNDEYMIRNIIHTSTGYEGPSFSRAENFGWSDDGRHVYAKPEYSVYHFSLEGNGTTVWDGNGNAGVLNFTDGVIITRDIIYNDQLYNHMFTQDLKKNQNQPLLTIEGVSTNRYRFAWNRDHTQAVFVANFCDAANLCEDKMYYFDAVKHKSILVGTQYDLLHWYADCLEGDCRQVWSDDSKIVLIRGVDTDFIFHTETLEMTPLDGHLTSWAWSNESVVLQLDSELRIYNWLTNTFIPYGREFYRRLPVPSPDGTYYALTGQLDPAIWNIGASTTQSWTRHQQTTRTGEVMDYKWNDNSRWFFSASNSSNCCVAGAIMIHQVDSPDRREVTVCVVLSGCAGFVPERAVGYLSTIPDSLVKILTPTITLVHDHNTDTISWNTDGTQLAVCGSNKTYEPTISIWSLQDDEGTLTHTMSPVPSCRNLQWKSDTVIQVAMNDTFAEINIETGKSSPVDTPVQSVNDYEYTFDTTATYETVITVVDKTSNETVFSLTTDKNIFGADLSPSQNKFAFSTYYGPTFVYDTDTNELIATIFKAANDLAFSPDGTLLAISGTQWVTIYDLSDQ